MKITEIETGILPIPPNGWGAVEKIIWEYKQRLEKLGNEVPIRYLNAIDMDGGIVHCHIANLAVECKQRGIPYIFSLHDHHVVHYGKGSGAYNQNLEAIKGSIISFTHAEYLIDFFDTDKLFYLSHGVNTEFFQPPVQIKRPEHRLLCLANNGIGGNPTYDRKGFRFAIEAAMKLDLPITITGTDNNLKFFEENTDLRDYKKLNLILHNPTEDEILKIYQEHSIFLHPSILEAGHPNLTLLEAISCGLPIVGTYDGSKEIKSLCKISANTESVIAGIEKVINNYDYYVAETQLDKKNFDWDVIVNRLNNILQTVNIIKKPYDSQETKNLYLKTYEKTKMEIKKVEPKIEFIFHSVNGIYFEMKCKIPSDKRYRVEFWSGDKIVHYDNVTTNMWIRLNKKYYLDMRYKVIDEDKVIYEGKLDFTGKRVFLSFESKSLGDTIAWMPYCREFKKKYKCHVIVCTFWNHLFEKAYSELEFVKLGTVVNDLAAMYKLGWFYDNEMEPVLPSTIPLQQAASNILGLDFKEIKPDIDKDYLHFDSPDKKLVTGLKYVTIATHSTSGLKYWADENWQTLIDMLVQQGYSVLVVSKESTDFKNTIKLKDTSILNTMNVIHHSEFFIGLSSGLSWLAWALDKKVYMIANFTTKDHEFQSNCIRFSDEAVCHGCWNNPMFKFDKGDWNWCPEHKGTDRQFECQQAITPQQVISKINETN
jgi:autotransporter strand-loop-strand O-heptosyltransferase